MMNIINKYINIKQTDYFLSEKYLILRKEKNTLLIISNNQVTTCIKRNSAVYVESIKKNTLYFTNSEYLYKLNFLNNQLSEIGNYDYVESIDNTILVSFEKNEKWVLGVYDTKSKNIISFLSNNPKCEVVDNVVITYPKELEQTIVRTFFQRINPITLKTIFDCDLTKILNSNLEFKKLLGIHCDRLWIQINLAQIIAIDVNTGKLLHELFFDSLFNIFTTNPETNFGIGDIYLDKEKGILKGLAYRYYFEIDLNTLKGEIKKDFGADLKNSWRITRSRFYEGDKNLYFIGALHGEAVNRAVGIFDTEQCEIVWYDEPLEEKKFLFYVEPPQRNDEILAVLDSENNLHIYDREKDM